MNCESFDDAVLDLLYGEGDSAVAAEARRHVSSCARCKKVYETLDLARQEVQLEELPVPSGLESRILTAAALARPPRLGLWSAIDRFISVAGALAMRPQVAMGALLVLMCGSSLLLLRARPAGPGSVVVTERGAPGAEGAVAAAPAIAVAADRRGTPESYADRAADKWKGDGKADVAPPSAAPPAATAMAGAVAASAAPSDAQVPALTIPEAVASDPTFAAAMEDYRAKRFENALRTFDVVESGGGEAAATAALYAARSLRFGKGCSAALVRYETIPTKYPGTPSAQEAMWDAAACHRELGGTDQARQLYQALRKTPASRDRAEAALAELERGRASGGPGQARHAAPAKAKRASDINNGF
jgi:TolA-binding protein